MTSTRKGLGSGGRGEGVKSYCLLLMQKSWRLFNQNFVFGQKKVDIFLRYKLVI